MAESQASSGSEAQDSEAESICLLDFNTPLGLSFRAVRPELPRDHALCENEAGQAAGSAKSDQSCTRDRPAAGRWRQRSVLPHALW